MNNNRPGEKGSCLGPAEMERAFAAYSAATGAYSYKGLLLHRQLTDPAFLDTLPNFQPRPTDIFIASYPKTGTTWLENIVSLIVYDGDISKIKKRLEQRVTHLEVGIKRVHSLLLSQTFKSQPRIIATHLPAHLLPRKAFSGSSKIIYICRNPKDTAVSYWYHHKLANFLGNYSCPWDDFYGLFSEGKVCHGAWTDHVSGFWQRRNMPCLKIVKYEDMKQDLESSVKELAQYLGREHSQETIDKIVSLSTFNSMKENSLVNREKLPMVFNVFSMKETKFMRKGIIGDWKNHFSQEQSDHYDKIYEKFVNENPGISFRFSEIDCSK